MNKTIIKQTNMKNSNGSIVQIKEFENGIILYEWTERIPQTGSILSSKSFFSQGKTIEQAIKDYKNCGYTRID